MSDAEPVPAVHPGGPTNAFRVCGRHFFLTYPRCPIDRQYAISAFCAWFSDKLCGVTVAVEKHGDGTPHLHCALSFTQRFDVKNARVFDFDFGGLVYHPNIQTARDLPAVLRYVTKYGDFTSEGSHFGVDPSKNPSRLNEIAKRALSGSSLLTICDENPGMFLLHKKKFEELVTWHAEQTLLASLQEKALSIPSRLMLISAELLSSLSEPEKEILTWLRVNIIAGPRVFKSKQLYLYGPPNSGKTSFLRVLMTVLPTYVMPMEDFYDLFDQSRHSLVILDEFRAQKTIQFLNQWSDGQVMSVRKKGSQSLKTKNLPLIICSNFSIREAYSKSDDAHLEALQTRFLSVRCDNCFNLVKCLEQAFI